jgi:uncharacterized Zn finger protein (UPF0148 family)
MAKRGEGEWRDLVRQELKSGGTESPCPFCKLPRARRSDYIRCAACGVNWMDGEALDRDPRAARLRTLLDGVAMSKAKR